LSLLSGRLPPDRYDTLLVAGNVGPGEASFAPLAARYGARLRMLPSLGPELRPLADARALLSLVRLMREYRPHIVHTHTAKAGFVGRLAARIALGPRVVVVHTYHGHVLAGYFGRAKTTLFRWLERAMGVMSDRLIGVSDATVDDLVCMRVAPRNKFTVIPLGLDLDRFLALGAADGDEFRREIDAEPDDFLVLVVGRLVPIKRVDVALRAVAEARRRGVRVVLTVAGDGEERDALERLAADLGLADRVRFLGFRDDLERLVAGADVALLTSDNEGTPVALIEAGAGGLPSVATAVGGVGDIVTPATGRLVPAGDTGALAGALAELASDRGLRMRLGGAAREHVRAAYASPRLIRDVDVLYRTLMTRGS
jgi:glycosyltransferase involved in cell wall biosynthesis